jgi:hypothetical protein
MFHGNTEFAPLLGKSANDAYFQKEMDDEDGRGCTAWSTRAAPISQTSPFGAGCSEAEKILNLATRAPPLMVLRLAEEVSKLAEQEVLGTLAEKGMMIDPDDDADGGCGPGEGGYIEGLFSTLAMMAEIKATVALDWTRTQTTRATP